ncbi:MAG: sugar transferase [Planctomycetaceae bacterium]
MSGVYVRRTEGLSTRRLVLALDIAVLAAFAAIHGGVPGFAYAALALFGLKAARVYGPRIQPRLGEDVPRLLAAVVTPVIVLPLFTSNHDLGDILATLPLVVLALLVGRSLTYTILNHARAAGHRHDRVLVVGAGDRGIEMARILREHPRYGLEPIGFVDEIAIGTLPLPLLGGVDDLARLVSIYGIDRVIVAEWEGEDDVLLPALRACTARHVHVHVAPRLFQLGTAPASPSTDWLWTTPVVRLPQTPQQTRAWRVKRAIDVGVSGTALVVTAPLSLALAIAIKLSSPGPVLFRQTRVTEGGRPFELLKFRSMPVNDSSDTHWDGELQPTWIGKVMRKTGLDELPQLLNILRGDMSLVGPRPERPYFAERFTESIEGYADRLRVPAGLTGWAQVHGLRGDTSIEERAMFDNEYIEYWSLWRDVVIMVRTIKTFLAGEGR